MQYKRRPLPVKPLPLPKPTPENIADLTSALVNLGVGKRDAKLRVETLIIELPTGKFETYLIRLLRGLKRT